MLYCFGEKNVHGNSSCNHRCTYCTVDARADDNDLMQAHAESELSVQLTKETIHVPVGTANTRIRIDAYDGSGPAMILMHGITSSGKDFQPVLRDLMTMCRPFVMDLRGHGGSDKPASGYHYRDYVADLTTGIAALELDRPIVLGHSLGGIIAMYWAAQHPDVARALIIEDSPLRSGEDFRSAFDGWLALNAMPAPDLRAWYAAKNPAWSDAILDARTAAMTGTVRAAITELMQASMASDGIDSSPALSQITEPVLYLHGDIEYGSMVHPEDVDDLPNRIRDVTVQRVPGSGHTIHRSHPQDWLMHVREFLQGIEG